MSVVPVYRRRATPMHTARAGASGAFCASLALVALLYENPLVLGGALAATVVAAVGARAGRELARAAWVALPLALLIVAVNALVSQGGATVIARLGSFLGRRYDVTLEALAAGGAAALRIVALVAVCGLFSAAVDPDEIVRSLRRFGYRSALTAALACRLVPLLARDAARMGDAARCRPSPPGRVELVRAALGGALERSLDLAAALEVRGYAGARRPARTRRPWSRHDLAFLAAAAAIAALAIAARAAGAGGFAPYPTTSLDAGAAEAGLAAALALAAALPFAAPGARLGVARA